MRRLIVTAMFAGAVAACGPAIDELATIPACKAWMEALARCEAAAPPAMRASLKALGDSVRAANRSPPDNARLAEGCEAAATNLRKDAAALCPDVRWDLP